ncbi:hypothetical protein BDR22DRAFT_498252 [Usnea florida]
MAPTTLISRTYPKRKRAEISYHESSSEEDEASEESQSTATAKLRTTVSTKPLPKRKIFPFTLLPPELRNYIYELALIDPFIIYLAPKTEHLRRTVSSTFAPPGGLPNILLLNKAIHAETQSILYARNKFVFENTMALYTFLATIGPKNRATLTELIIQGWGEIKAHEPLHYPTLTMLADAVNLTRLQFDCLIAWDGPSKVAKELYRGGFRWLEAIGAAKGSLDAGVDIITVNESYSPRWMQNFVGSREEWMKVFEAELRRLLQRGA